MLEINTGGITIPIKRDGEDVGSISFNPSDVVFAENLYALLDKLEAKEKECKAKEKEYEAKEDEGENEIPNNIKEKITLYRESCEYVRGEIDILFGDDTSKIVFGSTNNFEVFEQFLNGVLPYIQEERDKKVAKYMNREQKRSAGLK